MNDSAERPQDARRKPPPGSAGGPDETQVSPPPPPQFGTPTHYGAAPSSILPPHASFAQPGTGRPAGSHPTPANFGSSESQQLTPYSAEPGSPPGTPYASHQTPSAYGSSETRAGIPYPQYDTPAAGGSSETRSATPYPGPSPQRGTPSPAGQNPQYDVRYPGPSPQRGTPSPAGQNPQYDVRYPGPSPQRGTPSPAGQNPQHGTPYPGPSPQRGTPSPAGQNPQHGTPYPGPSPQRGTPYPAGQIPQRGTPSPAGQNPQRGTPSPAGQSPQHGTPFPHERDASIHSPSPAVAGERRIDDYRLLHMLGEGGMGLVHLAEDVRLGRKVAVKLLRRELAADPVHRARFLREAQATAAIEHDHVVPILGIGETPEGSPYLVMPFLQGETLEARLERDPRTPLRHVLQIARETAEGLAAAHVRGLVHRDIKPDNLWLEGEPAAADPVRWFRRVRILDFGLARSFESDDMRVTVSGALLGTPKYMSPEQARGQSLDPRTDLFSLGVILYRMTTGRFPFEGPTVMSVLTALATFTPPAPNKSNPGLPKELSDLIERLLQKDRTARPDSADEVAAILRRIEDGLDHRRPVGAFPAAPPPENLASPSPAGYAGVSPLPPPPGGSGMNLLRPAPGSYGSQPALPPGPGGSGGFPVSGSGGYPVTGSGGFPVAPQSVSAGPQEPSRGIRLRVGAGLLYVGLVFWSCPLTWVLAWSIRSGGVGQIGLTLGVVVVTAVAVRAFSRLLGATRWESVLAALTVGPVLPALGLGWFHFAGGTNNLSDKGWWFLTLWGIAAVLAGLAPFVAALFFRRR